MLEINNLSVSVENKAIIRGLDLRLKPGEIHSLMGPNGSGKSTLAYTLAGHPFYQVTSGTASLNGHQLLDMSPNERARLGLFLAFQYPVTIEGISVQNFLKAAHDAIHGKKGSVLDFRKALAKRGKSLGIKPELLSRSLNDGFSGGEKKRVEVLQVLTLKPKVAIFDETDSGLDIDSIKLAALGIRQAVKEFNTACLVITHYQRILKYLKPDKVHIMLEGNIVKSGSLDLVTKLEKHGYKQLINK
jgi:Fe-S cluster assembly ATP-binding protein